MRISRAQTIAEYSLCLALIMLAVVTMQQYVKRGIQGRYADVVDHATASVSAHPQYEPYYVDFEQPSDLRILNMQETYTGRGKLRRDFTEDKKEIPVQTSVEQLNCYDDE